MKGGGIRVPGFGVKDGRVVKKPRKGQSVSQRIQARKSKRVRVARRGTSQ